MSDSRSNATDSDNFHEITPDDYHEIMPEGQVHVQGELEPAGTAPVEVRYSTVSKGKRKASDSERDSASEHSLEDGITYRELLAKRQKLKGGVAVRELRNRFALPTVRALTMGSSSYTGDPTLLASASRPTANNASSRHRSPFRDVPRSSGSRSGRRSVASSSSYRSGQGSNSSSATNPSIIDDHENLVARSHPIITEPEPVMPSPVAVARELQNPGRPSTPPDPPYPLLPPLSFEGVSSTSLPVASTEEPGLNFLDVTTLDIPMNTSLSTTVAPFQPLDIAPSHGTTPRLPHQIPLPTDQPYLNAESISSATMLPPQETSVFDDHEVAHPAPDIDYVMEGPNPVAQTTDFRSGGLRQQSPVVSVPAGPPPQLLADPGRPLVLADNAQFANAGTANMPVGGAVFTALIQQIGIMNDNITGLRNDIRHMRSEVPTIPQSTIPSTNVRDSHPHRSNRQPHSRNHLATGYAADCDDDDHRESPNKLWSHQKKRSPGSNIFNATIQDYTRHLLGLPSRDAAISMATLPSLEEVSNYDPESGDCCTEDDFRPDLRETKGTPWNISIAKVFVDSYIKSGKYTETNKDRIRKAFRRHLDYLHDKYKKQFKPPAVLEQQKRERAKSERRAALFRRRLDAAENFEDLKRHVTMLQRLGPNGMSSDEEDHENGVVQYKVLVKEWRAEELTPWLRVFDAAVRYSRLEPFPRLRGCHPRIRHSSEQQGSTTTGVTGLPHNAYNERWLQSLTAYRREQLDASEESYEFQHTPRAMMMAQEYSGTYNNERQYI
ncbi:hypothetical protein QCA50_010289 [Cerrena zonata]|uniref:Uncharacterized protein n=1 Tax=Cerrena zonata TaxID=2478898 RepID=A0AAW0G5L2_9APHY